MLLYMRSKKRNPLTKYLNSALLIHTTISPLQKTPFFEKNNNNKVYLRTGVS